MLSATPCQPKERKKHHGAIRNMITASSHVLSLSLQQLAANVRQTRGLLLSLLSKTSASFGMPPSECLLLLSPPPPKGLLLLPPAPPPRPLAYRGRLRHLRQDVRTCGFFSQVQVRDGAMERLRTCYSESERDGVVMIVCVESLFLMHRGTSPYGSRPTTPQIN
jgi:hypothetical protein